MRGDVEGGAGRPVGFADVDEEEDGAGYDGEDAPRSL